MPVVCVGVSHHSTSVALREPLAFSPAEHREFLTSAVREIEAAGLAEVALLTTCNRTELYAASSDVSRRFSAVPDRLPQLLAARWAGSDVSLEPYLSTWVNTDAVRHLCRVAAGLDSMVIGEHEVLGQVAAAHELAMSERTTGPVLDATFQTAVRAGRRARSETGIARQPSSVSSEAVRQLRALWGELAAAKVLIVGTGQAGRLAGEALRKHGVRQLSVVGRTAAQADVLAGAWGAVALPWHALEAAIREADIIVSCTGAPHAVLTRELVESALQGRDRARPLMIADIAVPRDVEPVVRSLPGVTVLDLDDVQRQVLDNLAVRHEEIPTVEAIVEEEVSRFEEWRRGAELRPVLSALWARGEAIRRRELEKALRSLGPIPPEVRDQLEVLTRSLVSKLLDAPARRLREETDLERREAYARASMDLFGLADRGAPPEDGRD
jgi:glutamyl-tRNA reductase